MICFCWYPFFDESSTLPVNLDNGLWLGRYQQKYPELDPWGIKIECYANTNSHVFFEYVWNKTRKDAVWQVQKCDLISLSKSKLEIRIWWINFSFVRNGFKCPFHERILLTIPNRWKFRFSSVFQFLVIKLKIVSYQPSYLNLDVNRWKFLTKDNERIDAKWVWVTDLHVRCLQTPQNTWQTKSWTLRYIYTTVMSTFVTFTDHANDVMQMIFPQDNLWLIVSTAWWFCDFFSTLALEIRQPFPEPSNFKI